MPQSSNHQISRARSAQKIELMRQPKKMPRAGASGSSSKAGVRGRNLTMSADLGGDACSVSSSRTCGSPIVSSLLASSVAHAEGGHVALLTHADAWSSTADLLEVEARHWWERLAKNTTELMERS